MATPLEILMKVAGHEDVKKAISDVRADINATKDATAQATSAFSSMRGILGTLGIGLSAAALVEFAKSSLETAAGIGRLAEQANISAQAFQVLSYASIHAGMGTNELASALEVMRRNLAMAADGSEKQNKAIRELGLRTEELLALSAEKQIEAIAYAYTHAADKGKAWADVVALLGRNSAQLQQVIDKLGVNGFSGLTRGLLISNDSIALLERGAVGWKTIGQNISAVLATIATSKPSEALMNLAIAMGISQAQGKKSVGPPVADPVKVSEVRANMLATLATSTQMVTANDELAKAINKAATATDNLWQKRAALLQQAQAKGETSLAMFATGHPEDVAKGVKLAAEAVNLQTEAEKVSLEIKKRIFEVDKANAAGMAAATQKAIELEAEENAKRIGYAEQRKREELQAIDRDFSLSDNEKWAKKAAMGGGVSGPDPTSLKQNLSSTFAQLRSEWGSIQQNIANGIRNTIGGALNSVSSGITQAIMRTKTWGQAFADVANTILSSVVGAIIQMGVQWVAGMIMRAVLGDVLKSASTKSSLAAAKLSLGAWAPAAMAASIASFGAADVAGMIGFTAAMGEAAITAAAGFDRGGYTGDGSPNSLAGFVHGSEFVFSAPATSAIGRGTLEAMHASALTANFGATPGAPGASGSQPIVLVQDPESLGRVMRSHTDARVYRITRKMQTVRAAL